MCRMKREAAGMMRSSQDGQIRQLLVKQLPQLLAADGQRARQAAGAGLPPLSCCRRRCCSTYGLSEMMR